jgi:hypothetical protein
MPHRSNSSHSNSRFRDSGYYDDYYSRPHSRHSGHRHKHHHHHTSRSGSYDDLDDYISSRGKHSHLSRSQTPDYSEKMYAPAKLTYPSVDYDTRRRHSTYGATSPRYENDGSPDYGDDPPRHAHVARSNRHSTFPPSAYHTSSQQRQVQPFQQPYVHPALPPQSPSLPPSRTGPPNSLVQHHQHPTSNYEQPRHMYQPPVGEVMRPAQPTRAESWGHSASAESLRRRDRSLSRTGSRSVPPGSRSRSIQGDARERTKDTPHSPWKKAKKVYNSTTANNTAELAMFGLLAVAKAL